MPTEIALAWRVSNEQLQPLFSWLNQFGYQWFNLRLAGVEASQINEFATDICVRLIDDIQCVLMRMHYQNWWVLSVSAEYQMPVTALIADGVGTKAISLGSGTDDLLRITEDVQQRATEDDVWRTIED